MQWYHVVGICIYVVGLVVTVIGHSMALHEAHRYLVRWPDDWKSPSEKDRYAYAVAESNRKFYARMLLLTPVWFIPIGYLAGKWALRLPVYLVGWAFPSLDKKAKEKQRLKEEADAQARLYPA